MNRTAFVQCILLFVCGTSVLLCYNVSAQSVSAIANSTTTADNVTLVTTDETQQITTDKSILSTISSNTTTSTKSSTTQPPLTVSSLSLVTFASNVSHTRKPITIIIQEPEDFNNNPVTPTSNKSSLAGSYPPDFIPDYIRNNGGVLIHIFILVYISLALGIVCDLYFLSSLEIISNALKLPSDIAGATFMAIGTSAPELFTSLIGVFISQDDIGTGTILGSAVFNLIFMPSACGFAAYFFSVDNSQISKFSILRDSIFYLITTTILLLALKDNEIDWIESLSMLMLFVIYLIIMYFNAKFSEYISQNMENADSLNEATPLLSQPKMNDFDIEKDFHPRTSSLRPRLSSMNEDGTMEEELNWIDSNVFVKWALFPLVLIFKITIPKPTKCCFIVTFFMSIIWISILTYLAVWMVVIIGDTFGIPQTVGGLTILAAGTSFPELISSVLVLKRAGLADMAICNSIGSNIFDILVCLGLPWFIKSVMNMFRLGTINLTSTMVPVQSNGLPMTTFTLLLTIIALIGSFSAFKWRMGLGIGITCGLIYIIFIIIASFLEIFLN